MTPRRFTYRSCRPIWLIITVFLVSGCITISDPIEEPSDAPVLILPTPIVLGSTPSVPPGPSPTEERKSPTPSPSPSPTKEPIKESTKEVTKEPTKKPTSTRVTNTKTAVPTRISTLESTWYTVGPGDTVSSIADQFGILFYDILDANNLGENSILNIGQELLIPSSEPTPSNEQDDEEETSEEETEEETSEEETEEETSEEETEEETSEEETEEETSGEIEEEDGEASSEEDDSAINANDTEQEADSIVVGFEDSENTSSDEEEEEEELASPTPIPIPKTEEGHIIHFVQVGETPSQIADQYGVERIDILLANGLRPDVQLTAGDTIIIPQGEYTAIVTPTPVIGSPVPTVVLTIEPSATPTVAITPTPTLVIAEVITHTITDGERAQIIADENEVTLDELAEANPDSDLDNLAVGEELVIPTPDAKATPSPTAITLSPTPTLTPVMATHVVEEGETAAEIANRHNISEDELGEHNDELDPDAELEAGMVIEVPVGSPTPEPSPTLPPTATSTPAPEFLAPVLLHPANGSEWTQEGKENPPQLLWTSTGLLEKDEYHVVRLRAIDENGDIIWSQSHWTQSPNWKLEQELSIIKGTVTLRWDVLVMRRTSEPGVNPPTGEALSEKSATFEFIYTYVAPTE